MQSVYLVKRWSHHTASGGYDRLARIIGGRSVGRSGKGNLAKRLAYKVWYKITPPKTYLMDYEFQDWWAEWQLIIQAWINRPDVVHCLYGDEQLDVILRHRRLLNCPLIATFHLPTNRNPVKGRFENFQKDIIHGIDAAIVVARNQLANFQNWLGSDRVFYIPHGIDTAVFSPGENNIVRDALQLICVGEHMRDFESLHRIMDECQKLKLSVELDIVASEKCRHFFYGSSNVRFHTKISETELIALYRQADALLMPIQEATANNAVLEAMACGTPVISTNIGGIPDYVNDQAGWLFPRGEVEGVIKLISAGAENREVFRALRMGARTHSLEFDWDRIKEQILVVYETACRNFC
jgi:glycosyltransferase involved in cell wall biosynthesis